MRETLRCSCTCCSAGQQSQPSRIPPPAARTGGARSADRHRAAALAGARERRYPVQPHRRRDERRQRLRADTEPDPAGVSERVPAVLVQVHRLSHGPRDPERRERHRRPERADRPRRVARESVRRERVLAEQPVRQRDLHERLRPRRTGEQRVRRMRTSASNAAHNIAQAFADVAAAGSSGKATFESRGGAATAPGTTVAEHRHLGARRQLRPRCRDTRSAAVLGQRGRRRRRDADREPEHARRHRQRSAVPRRRHRRQHGRRSPIVVQDQQRQSGRERRRRERLHDRSERCRTAATCSPTAGRSTSSPPAGR